MENIVNIISTLGFPIACCVAMFWQNDKQDSRHREETKELAKVIENNNVILAKICDKLDLESEVK